MPCIHLFFMVAMPAAAGPSRAPGRRRESGGQPPGAAGASVGTASPPVPYPLHCRLMITPVGGLAWWFACGLVPVRCNAASAFRVRSEWDCSLCRHSSPLPGFRAIAAGVAGIGLSVARWPFRAPCAPQLIGPPARDRRSGNACINPAKWPASYARLIPARHAVESASLQRCALAPCPRGHSAGVTEEVE